MALLDWRDAKHFDPYRDLPCRWCGKPTPLRDEQRRPSHKVCAEQHLTDQQPSTPDISGLLALPTPSASEEEVPLYSKEWHRITAVALSALSHGMPVFPLGRTKRPAIPSPHPDNRTCRGECGRFGHGVHDATTDPTTLQALFEAAPWATAYGIACGQEPHHLVGIDLDVKHGQDGPANFRALAEQHGFEIPPTTTVATPSGGWHLWFTAPPGTRIPNSQSKLGPGIDVRGTAGLLVGPGSRTTAGEYRFAPGSDPHTITPLPAPLLALLTAGPRTVTTVALPDPAVLRERVRAQGAYNDAVLTREGDKIRAQKQPGRKTRLWSCSATVGRHVAAGTLAESVAFEALMSAGLSTGLDARTCERTIRSGFARAAH
ncbi:bifunctional DNA primase/polymerase [Kitasatospora sp. NPDC058965]|uniref:bifunctional DNA primase/polymerase n=1 Tax=Kitasatospora sp. NPDC058965 TaxID=3346682 RepID=UPI0036AE3263